MNECIFLNENKLLLTVDGWKVDGWKVCGRTLLPLCEGGVVGPGAPLDPPTYAVDGWPSATMALFSAALPLGLVFKVSALVKRSLKRGILLPPPRPRLLSERRLFPDELIFILRSFEERVNTSFEEIVHTVHKSSFVIRHKCLQSNEGARAAPYYIGGPTWWGQGHMHSWRVKPKKTTTRTPSHASDAALVRQYLEYFVYFGKRTENISFF